METNLEPPNSTAISSTATTTTTSDNDKQNNSSDVNDEDYETDHYYIDDSNCSTPYVSAPSSPGRSFTNGIGFFYSAPASPMHYVLSTTPARSSAVAGGSGGTLAPAISDASSSGSFEFEFSARFDSPAPEIGSSMSSADELFLNGQIRPMKLSAHLQRPQALAPLIDLGGESERENDDDDDVDDDVFKRSRDLRWRSRSQRRRTRSLSPLRSTTPFDWFSTDDVVMTPKKNEEERENNGKEERENDATTTPSGSASSSRCSSAGRSSKRWIFLKDFLRSKSEGRSNNKFWHNISFSPAKDKKERERNNNANANANTPSFLSSEKTKARKKDGVGKEGPARKSPATAAGKRRSAHEMHYAANRAQAEELRKKTFLPYRQGLLGCLGFNSKSYGALNGFARALNPVSST